VADVYHRWGPVLLVALLGLPGAVFIGRIRGRTLGRRYANGRRRAIGEVVAVAGTLPWIWLLFTPNDAAYRELHLNPFDDVFWYLQVSRTYMIVQIVGNLAVLAAFGAGAPMRWRLNLPAVTLAAAAMSTAVEIIQYQLDIGRVASSTDVLLNTTGAVLAAAMTRRWWVRTEVQAPGTVSVQ
jgi:hypothetical protein